MMSLVIDQNNFPKNDGFHRQSNFTDVNVAIHYNLSQLNLRRVWRYRKTETKDDLEKLTFGKLRIIVTQKLLNVNSRLDLDIIFV